MLDGLRRLLGLARKPTLFEWMVQQVEQHRPTPIQGILDGEVLVEGQARAGDTLVEAPITGISVIGFRATVEAHDSAGAHKVVDWSQVTNFVVEDATGQALVRTSGCKMVLNLEYSGDSASGGLPSAVMALVNRFGAVDWSRQAPSHFSWNEYYLEPGEPVIVFGRARQEVDPSKAPVGYRQSASRLVLDSPERRPLFFSDQLRDTFLQKMRG